MSELVRGVNVFPSALESIVRHFDGVTEFRLEAYSERGKARRFTRHREAETV